MSNVQKYSSRLAAVGLLVALVVAVYGALAMPLVEAHSRLNLAQKETREQLDRYAQIAARRPAIEVLLTKLESQQVSTSIYLHGSTDPLAAVELQDRINAQIKRTGGKLRSIQVLRAETNESFKRVAISVQLTTTMSAFHNLLYAIEASRPLLEIRNLEIKNTRRRTNNNKQTEEPVLLIRFDVFGFLKPVKA
jgi:hypothetical protein